MIRILPESIIRSIAAGEVIERPSSVVKELLENAIDANATSIELSLVDGGIKRILVRDNGKGMSGEDVDACLLPHATSKISKQDDLLAISTLGFRGEALPSISACSHIHIESSLGEGQGRSITAENSKIVAKQDTILTNAGTTVEVEDLFFYLPARRRFLKKAHTEYLACRGIFEDMALCHPEVTFKLTKDKKLDLIFPEGTLKERLEQVWADQLKSDDLIWLEKSTDNIHLQFIGTKPSLARRDRRFMKIFVNGRRIEDSTLLGAISKSYEGILTAGFYPYATLHLQINPEMVDFNIHPTKKEVRFLHLPYLVEFLIKSIRSYFYENLKDLVPPFETEEDEEIFRALQSSFLSPEIASPSLSALESPSDFLETDNPPTSSLADLLGAQISSPPPEVTSASAKDLGFKYLGQFASRYLLLEFEEKLVLIDQHAGHERILFEGFKVESAKEAEKLIFPYPFATESPIPRAQLAEYEKIGVLIRTLNEDPAISLWEYELIGLPKLCLSMESLIVDFIKENINHIVTDLFFKLYSYLASQRAIKSGEVISYERALEIVREIFQNKWFSCPHGRPLWLEFKKSYFDNLIKRT